MSIKTFVIDGNGFSDMEGFYEEIDRVLTKDLDWETGHNLNAFNDLLWGGFGQFEYEESIILVWKHFLKSEKSLGKDLVGRIEEIISEHEHISFFKQ